MGAHGSDERSVRDHHLVCSDRNSEGDIERVIGGMVYRKADLQCDIVQCKPRCRRRLQLGTQQYQAFPRFIRCQQLPADLQPRTLQASISQNSGTNKVSPPTANAFARSLSGSSSTHLRPTEASTTSVMSGAFLISGEGSQPLRTRLL